MEQNRYEIFRRRAEQFVRWYDRGFVAEYLKTCCGQEAAQVLAGADELMEQTFRFTDRWDMEPCAVPYHFENMVWSQSPDGDPEWVYMLNRHDCLNKLMTAYDLTGNITYVQKLKWYLAHWMEHNPITPEGTETTRTIDTGIRCMNWGWLLLHLTGEGLIQQQEAERILAGIAEQTVSLRERYIPKYTLSNWGVLQTTAICQGYLLFEAYLPQDGLREWAFSELKRQLQLQVLEDGSQWEQSMMYHMEVLLCSMKLLSVWDYVAKTEQRECEDRQWLREIVERMSRYVLYAAGPDHCQIAQCDSDVTDVRDVLTKGAVLTGSQELRFGGYRQMDMESALLLGRQGIISYGKMKGEQPSKRHYHAIDTGNLYFRSSWKPDGNFTYLTCGPLGSGHGHADLTHLSLYYGGKPFLVDSGRYSYREDEPLRVKLKLAEAHNVCVIDGESMGMPRGSWGFERYATCFKTYYRNQPGVHFAEMAYHGALESGASCTVIRRVMAADAGIWLVVNDIICDGAHQTAEYYHLAPAVKAETGGDASGGWLLSRDGLQLRLTGSAPFEKENCVISETYNAQRESSCLVKRTAWTNRLTDWSSLAGCHVRIQDIPVYQAGSREPADSRVVTAREYVLSDGEAWIFLIWNQETFRGSKLYLCDQVPVYGKAVAIHRKAGERQVYRLKN
ncbi:MAG: alginate lyase family protein [Eubacteriales bacterium]|nr:alginate lyase family protein [Eubacteriales bacterium]